ncbi:MAG TPA: M23 family metallopeptidase [Blastocatellia bacterium]|nr:M23 family metallopeptidase [Blastocatellia bacterium]
MKIAAFLFLFLLLTSTVSAQPGNRDQTVTWEPAKLVNGSPCVFRFKPARQLESLGGKWLGKKVWFSFDGGSGAWVGFAGIDIDTKPGGHQLELEAVARGGERLTFNQVVPIEKGFYPVTTLTVPRKYVEPAPEDLARIQQERKIKDETFSRITNERLWSGGFTAPVGTPTTAGFGSQRTYNGQRQSIHQGLDFRAATGTPVKAVNSGRVILAREFYFEGGLLVIDHGQGLLTLYLHLSAFRVKEGDTVGRGQLVALSGGTGRATGPHLHLAVRWQGVYVDPATLLRLPLPQ